MQQELIPHLFRTGFSKITAVLGKLFGFEHIEIAEDIAGDTFLLASETWGLKGVPENPAAWLYTVAKNKACLVERIGYSLHPATRREANVKSKAPLELRFACGPLILTFATESAATWREC